MSRSTLSLRSVLVGWLYAAALGHLLGGIVLTWAGPSGVLDPYLSILEQAFWNGPAPAPARAQQVWWLALFGATLQSNSLYMLALVHLGNRYRSVMAWGFLIAGLLLWAPQDLFVSAQAKVWSHLWVDLFALLVLLPALFWLYRHDGRQPPAAVADGCLEK